MFLDKNVFSHNQMIFFENVHDGRNKMQTNAVQRTSIIGLVIVFKPREHSCNFLHTWLCGAIMFAEQSAYCEHLMEVDKNGTVKTMQISVKEISCRYRCIAMINTKEKNQTSFAIYSTNRQIILFSFLNFLSKATKPINCCSDTYRWKDSSKIALNEWFFG